MHPPHDGIQQDNTVLYTARLMSHVNNARTHHQRYHRTALHREYTTPSVLCCHHPVRPARHIYTSSTHSDS